MTGMADVDMRSKSTPTSSHILRETAPLVFIHAATRTSSTWFWLKFRELSSTLCYYEPFSATLNWLTPERIPAFGLDWDSRHPPRDPYYREYGPLLRKGGGVQLFEEAMTVQWFIPKGGLRGDLRSSEKDYLSLLIRHASETGKIPVFGDCWSHGRMWAIKQALGGVNIFQYRNLWQQWLSFLSYKRRGDMTFYVIVMDIICREDEPYFQYLAKCGYELANKPWTGTGPKPSPLRWGRTYPNITRDEDKVRALELMPEHHAFSLFMGLHIYLYMHAQLCADIATDVTRMARDQEYRSKIEREIKSQSGLAVSFADVADIRPPTGVEFDHISVDWDEIRKHARVAVQMLTQFGDPTRLAASAETFIAETIQEMRKTSGKAVVAQSTNVATEQSSPVAKSIGVCMIVKNETKVIRHCLESTLPLVDYILVVDTGSTDGTQQMIRDFLAEHNVKGAIIDEPWRDFAYNRSFAF